MPALRVLHVEDHPDIREVVRASLRLDPELDSRDCGSGQEALKIAVDWPPDIILLDVMMPGMDGPMTLTRLRADPRTAHIPVVFLTVRAQQREQDLFRTLGAAGVIPKPFDPMTLATSVRGYIQPSREDLDTRHEFLRRVSDNAGTLVWRRSAVAKLTASTEVLIEIREIAHELANSGAAYGFSEMATAAALLEEVTIAALRAPGASNKMPDVLDALLMRIASDTASAEDRKPLFGSAGKLSWPN
jgi:CheY-like chemotaxis protein